MIRVEKAATLAELRAEAAHYRAHLARTGQTLEDLIVRYARSGPSDMTIQELHLLRLEMTIERADGSTRGPEATPRSWWEEPLAAIG